MLNSLLMSFLYIHRETDVSVTYIKNIRPITPIINLRDRSYLYSARDGSNQFNQILIKRMLVLESTDLSMKSFLKLPQDTICMTMDGIMKLLLLLLLTASFARFTFTITMTRAYGEAFLG